MEHSNSVRQYAHTYHIEDTVCLAKAAGDLPDRHLYAILAHEVGHLIIGPGGSEYQANQAAERFFKVKIRYKPQTWYGHNLQILSPEHLKKVKDALEIKIIEV